MNDIRELFYSEGLSLYDTLSSNDVIGFLVPLYQRKYSWDKKHISRLLEDILDGITSIKQDKEAINFIGAAIFVEISVEAFRTKASSIVDGQQRLTTLILLSSLLHQLLGERLNDLKQVNSSFSRLLSDRIKERLDELFACFSKSKSPLPKKSSDYYPIIIREHVDKWHKSSHQSNYDSPVADYLNQYIHYVYDNENKSFGWNKKRDGVDINFFVDNESFIKEWLDSLLSNNYFDNIIESVLNTRIGSVLFGFDEEEKREIIKEYTPNKNEKSVNDSIILLCFSEYLLRRVAITNVRVADERYGFDIFEALNTTGAPLTAIETFRPVVARYYDQYFSETGGYERSDSKLIFDDIDRYLDKKKNTLQKTKESQQIVVTFAYLTRGEKIAEKLDVQRVCLKKWYEEIEPNDPESKKRYVNCLGSIVDFKDRFWSSSNLASELSYHPEHREEIIFHLDFLRDSKTTMVIPILLRFYMDYLESDNISEFLNACRSIASFVAIWRAYTCNTGAIDSALKTLMSGGTANSNNYSGYRLGLKLNNKIKDSAHLKSFLRDLLIKKKIRNKASWIEIASTQPLYTGSQELCKYLLMVAHHNAIFKDKKLNKGAARANESTNYMKLSVYRSELYDTVEHVAPQNSAGDWDKVFEKDATTVHTIGNLTLLPMKENNVIGNKSWEKKKLFFEACSAKDTDELNAALEKSRKAGLQFSNKTVSILRASGCLTMASHLIAYDTWTHETVNDRSKNILECVWNELSGDVGMS